MMDKEDEVTDIASDICSRPILCHSSSIRFPQQWYRDYSHSKLFLLDNEHVTFCTRSWENNNLEVTASAVTNRLPRGRLHEVRCWGHEWYGYPLGVFKMEHKQCVVFCHIQRYSVKFATSQSLWTQKAFYDLLHEWMIGLGITPWLSQLANFAPPHYNCVSQWSC